MIIDLEELEKLGVKMDKELQVDLILQSLPRGLLKSSKGTVHVVERASSSKRKSNWKKKPAKKQKTENKPKKEASKNKAADKGKCFHCNVDGHWKRNCPVYLESLKNKRKDTSSEGMSDLLGLRESRGLREGEVTLRVGNGARVAAVAAGTYSLRLPSGYVLLLKDCYYVPPASRNLISAQDEEVNEMFLMGDREHGDDPKTYNEAMSDIDSEKWLDAMKSEIDSMHSNQETFSPVAMLKFIRTLLALAEYYDYEIWQMDVKTAFLNRYVEEDIYMEQPLGFTFGDESHKNEEEPCVYKKVSGRAVTFLVLYVDDVLLIGNDIPMLTSVKIWLSKEFFMKDLGEASYILGIKKMCPNTFEEIQRMSKIPYASAIGSLMYAMLCTRPDIALAVSVTSRYQSNPGEEHWIAVKNILKYLRRTKDMFLVFGGGELKLQ
ncbi:uncharacterized protein LOC109705542 [Ananas comosus]|uniref:Uncharacterized protein LOC109705542 n=1 Tax=Ananas comosus TaxID=4615 RepID=A0A6P5EEP2_ANACO|nr:uncharacterized protein LOC109705542 [Ananas comosus]